MSESHTGHRVEYLFLTDNVGVAPAGTSDETRAAVERLAWLRPDGGRIVLVKGQGAEHGILLEEYGIPYRESPSAEDGHAESFEGFVVDGVPCDGLTLPDRAAVLRHLEVYCEAVRATFPSLDVFPFVNDLFVVARAFVSEGSPYFGRVHDVQARMRGYAVAPGYLH